MSPEKQRKTTGNQLLERNSCRPAPLHVSKTRTAEVDTSKKCTKKCVSTEEKKSLNSHRKGSSIDLDRKLNSSLSLVDSKQVSTNVTPAVNDSKGSLESGAYQEKKASDHGIVKDSSADAKVSDGTNSLAKTSGSGKNSDQADFAENGKSSLCGGSTSSDVSDESTCSSFSSSINKPHKANYSRWEAIQVVRTKDGGLGLSHFRLLERLGFGDIGSVYVSELSGTKSYFAMKVMDKAALASRKKLLRAQTEREILQCLDHPFLPSHFETDKFSCLVMEFCTGGELHILQQRQPGKHFSEQAVKRYYFSEGKGG